MQRHCENGRKVAEFLAGHPKVSKVYWPGFEDHPNHTVAKEQMNDFGGMISFALLLFFSPSLVYKVNRFETVSLAVVLEAEARLYSGPGEQYELLFRVHEGTTFTIEGRHDEWLSVKLPDGRGGFVRASKLGEV
jgi:hypothetical protein